MPNQLFPLFKAIQSEGIPFTSHSSDLYIPVTGRTRVLVKEYEASSGCRASQFKHLALNTLWFYVPFAYLPFWEAKAARLQPLETFAPAADADADATPI